MIALSRRELQIYFKLDLLLPWAQWMRKRGEFPMPHHTLISLNTRWQLYCTLLCVRILIDNVVTPEIAH